MTNAITEVEFHEEDFAAGQLLAARQARKRYDGRLKGQERATLGPESPSMWQLSVK